MKSIGLIYIYLIGLYRVTILLKETFLRCLILLTIEFLAEETTTLSLSMRFVWLEQTGCIPVVCLLPSDQRVLLFYLQILFRNYIANEMTHSPDFLCEMKKQKNIYTLPMS